VRQMFAREVMLRYLHYLGSGPIDFRRAA
jgi:hypothetical protein